MLEPSAQASFVTGLTLMATLIVAIGAQNTFVLRQGLRREHVAAVAALCIAIDVVLMGAGVGGLGALVTDRPGLLRALALVGAAVLAWYAWAGLRRACAAHALVTSAAGTPQPVARVLAQVAGISLLNPHVYLDTVVLVGAVGARQAAGTQGVFLLGAALASALWFTARGFGARLLQPLFARAVAWRVLDAAAGGLMLWLAAGLARGALAG